MAHIETRVITLALELRGASRHPGAPRRSGCDCGHTFIAWAQRGWALLGTLAIKKSNVRYHFNMGTRYIKKRNRFKLRNRARKVLLNVTNATSRSEDTNVTHDSNTSRLKTPSTGVYA